MHVELDVELPHELAVGAGTALFVCGWGYEAGADIRALRFVLGGERQPVMAFGMPRLDPFQELQEPASYRSGFWGLVRVRPAGAAPGTTLRLALEADLSDGRTVTAPLPPIAVVDLPREPPPPIEIPPGDGPLVAVCMAAHEPADDLLQRQLESIRAQTHARWVCLISDDASSPARHAALAGAVAGDPRFAVSRSPHRLGFYRNFERALAMAPPEADYVALADQDDRWHPDKLASLLSAIGDARLAYSDCRVVTRDGTVLSDTYWSDRRPNHGDMLSLLVANSVSGAGTLVRRDLLDDALPFPPAQFAHYHDHWLALVARSLGEGEIRFVDRPLYDYVQHDRAALGHAAANRMPSLRSRLRHRDPRERVRLYRLHYFVDACRLAQCASILQMRCGDRITADSRRALHTLTTADRSLTALSRLAYRGALELTGARHETLGAEWALFRAFGWRRLLGATARDRPQRRLRLDAVPPPDLAPRPTGAGAGAAAALPAAARAIAAKIEPLALAPSDAEPVRVNLLIPTIDLDHFFAGYIAKFNLARRLAERGLRVRIVTVDPTGALPRTWRRTIETYSGLAGALERIEVAFGREQAPLGVNPADGWIATTWWTAHIAGAAIAQLEAERFLYLVQEYEPFTFPMGTYAALAAQSYDTPHVALFSSELLREYFRRHRIGVFTQTDGETLSASFQNAITDVSPPPVAELLARRPRRLLVYARPEPHAARNLYELALLALAQAALPDDWELNGIGSVGAEQTVPLGDGRALRLLPRTGQNEYARVLRSHDVGLALMYTPHPSLVPLEMAAAGMLTVTSTFENKTADALRGLSANIAACPPTVQAVAAAVSDAIGHAGDAEGRVAGSTVNWSRDWGESFGDDLLRRLIAALGWTASA